MASDFKILGTTQALAMRIPRIVPWISADEHLQVYDWLYASDPHLRALGVKRVRMWASRGKVPHAVDSTATFVELQLKDRERGCSALELRLMYSMAFVRFVNGLVDPLQKRAFAQSISSIADRLRLPHWFVELRHAATHEHMPSLEVLRNATHKALLWIQDNYWAEVERSRVEDVKMEDENEEGEKEAVRKAVKKYKEIRKGQIKERRVETKTKTKSSVAKEKPDPIASTLSEIISAAREHSLREALLPVLLEIGHLVPVSKKKRPSPPEFDISPELLELWQPLLQKCDETWSSFTEELIQVILEKLSSAEENLFTSATQEVAKNAEQTSSSYMFTLTAWLKYLLRLYYVENNASIRPDDILEACLRQPNLHTRVILQCMVEYDPSLGAELSPFFQYIDKMLSIFQNAKQNAQSVNLSEEDFEQEIKLLEMQLESQSKELSENSRLVPQVEPETLPKNVSAVSDVYPYDPQAWAACPIGYLPGNIMPNLDLPIEIDMPEEV
ncbi:uncharacterized protein VTP21DRAFT_4468 [Calcarisporiella thermophila]|uniref:uncharacterized protein n=1 Tax=Calcarisporiella thermophila TaxID=911321 RepID=UPI003742BA92